MGPNPQFPADVVKFAEEILSGKLLFVQWLYQSFTICEDYLYTLFQKTIFVTHSQTKLKTLYLDEYSHWIKSWEIVHEVSTGFTVLQM